MQIAQLDNQLKLKLLLISSIVIGFLSLPFAMPHILIGHGIYYSLHVGSIVLGTFLSIIGVITCRQFKTTRLFLVMCAFLTVTIAESFSFVNLLFPFVQSNLGIDSIVSHSLVLLMLSFFVVGIFRSK